MITCFFLLSFWASYATANEPIVPIVAPENLSQGKVKLGKALFHEVGLSQDGAVSCASCHNLESGGADEFRLSTGAYGRLGEVNSPTVFNSALLVRQFWNGRAVTLESQIEGPLMRPTEMDSSWPSIIKFLEENERYKHQFDTLYSEGVTQANILHAIAEFERSLTLPNSRFDQYLKGKKDAISVDEEKGYKRFKSYGCVACHQGAAVGGNMYQKFGVMRDYFAERKTPVTHADLGRFNVTGNPQDKFVFKVPSLRMVSLTAPYFHDGSAKTLHEAIKVMGKYQLGIMIPEEDVTLIELFLGTLPGPYNGEEW